MSRSITRSRCDHSSARCALARALHRLPPARRRDRGAHHRRSPSTRSSRSPRSTRSTSSSWSTTRRPWPTSSESSRTRCPISCAASCSRSASTRRPRLADRQARRSAEGRGPAVRRRLRAGVHADHRHAHRRDLVVARRHGLETLRAATSRTATTTTRATSSRAGRRRQPSRRPASLRFLAWYPDVEQNQNKARHPEPPVPATTSLDALGDAFTELVVGVGQTRLRARGPARERLSLPRPARPVDEDRRDADTRKASYGPRRSRRRRAARASARRSSVPTRSSPSSCSATRTIRRSIRSRSTARPGASATISASRAERARARALRRRAECTSCEFVQTCNARTRRARTLKADPACATTGGLLAATEDPLNVRFHAMKQPLRRRPAVPDLALRRRVHEDEGAAPCQRARARRVRRQARLHEPALRRTPAERAERGALQAAAWLAHERPRLLRDHRWRAEPAPAGQRRIVGDRLDEDPRQGSGALRRDRHRPAHDPVDEAARRPPCADGARPTPTPFTGASGRPAGTDLEFACTFELYENAERRDRPDASYVRRERLVVRLRRQAQHAAL